MPNIIFLGCSEKCDESSLITDDSEVDTALHIKLLITVEIFPFGRAGPILQCLQSKILAMLSRHCFCCSPVFSHHITLHKCSSPVNKKDQLESASRKLIKINDFNIEQIRFRYNLIVRWMHGSFTIVQGWPSFVP